MYYYLTMGLAVISSMLYHVFQKAIPSNVSPVASLLVTYGVAFLVTLMIFIFSVDRGSLLASIKGVTWVSCALGVAIVGLELGFLLAYRAGWNVSIGAIVSSVTVTVLLIPIGIVVFKEAISGWQITGLLMCVAGLVLVNLK